METCLVGGESDELETGQLSPLWQVFEQGGIGREAVCYSGGCEVSELRQPEAVEGWIEEDSFGSAEAAVFLSRLRSSFLLILNAPFFFLVNRSLVLLFGDFRQ